MGSSLSTIRQLLADQIDADTVTDGSDPSKTLLNTYINEAIRVITRRDRPRELMTATPITADIVINTNTVTVPTTILVPESVYYKDSSGKFRELKQYDYKDLIQFEGSGNFFDSSNTGDPIYYAIQGTSLIFILFLSFPLNYHIFFLIYSISIYNFSLVLYNILNINAVSSSFKYTISPMQIKL